LGCPSNHRPEEECSVLLWRQHDNDAKHIRVECAEIRVRSRLREAQGEALIGRQQATLHVAVRRHFRAPYGGNIRLRLEKARFGRKSSDDGCVCYTRWPCISSRRKAQHALVSSGVGRRLPPGHVHGPLEDSGQGPRNPVAEATIAGIGAAAGETPASQPVGKVSAGGPVRPAQAVDRKTASAACQARDFHAQPTRGPTTDHD